MQGMPRCAIRRPTWSFWKPCRRQWEGGRRQLPSALPLPTPVFENGLTAHEIQKGTVSVFHTFLTHQPFLGVVPEFELDAAGDAVMNTVLRLARHVDLACA